MLSEPLSTAEFGDQRLTSRFVSIMDRLSQKPSMSIPAAMNGRAEMEAAYRFFNNSKVTPEAIMAPHLTATQERIRQSEVVLLVQDTTQIDLTRPEQQVEGAGPMDSESRRGFFYHPLFAFDAQGLPLGTAWSHSWTREKRPQGRTRKEYLDQLRSRPIEDKESQCWVDGLRAARDVAASCPQTQCICVCDSESDIYEFFSEPRTVGDTGAVDLLVRACQNRTLIDSNDHLRDAVQATPCLYECNIDVSRRQSTKTAVEDRKRKMPRDAREAQVEVRACTVTLKPPRRNDRELPQVTLNVVVVTEPSPPEGQIPLEWLLVTTLPIDNIDQIKLVVHYYTIRWQIEVYFRTLKSGCRIEYRYFERMGCILNCLAVYSVVAWKVFYLCRLSHECPELNCEVIYEPSEWKPVYMAITKREPPKTPPSLNDMTRMIASLGGYVIRKSTRPGTQTLWLGLQRLHDLSMAWTTFGPET
jgi:hypothetical protein